jgi:hypothetical protein
MSCITWLGRIVSRIFITGFRPPGAGDHYLTTVIPAERFIRRYIATGLSWRAEDLVGVVAPSSEAAERETKAELGRTICTPLWHKWQDFHLGPGFVSVVSGLPKDFSSSRFRRGQFGDDAWFIAQNSNADVIGML